MLNNEQYKKKKLQLSLQLFFLVGEDGFVCISARRAEIEVRLRRAVAGNCPPDSCIEMFESATLSATTKNRYPYG